MLFKQAPDDLLCLCLALVGVRRPRPRAGQSRDGAVTLCLVTGPQGSGGSQQVWILPMWADACPPGSGTSGSQPSLVRTRVLGWGPTFPVAERGAGASVWGQSDAGAPLASARISPTPRGRMMDWGEDSCSRLQGALGLDVMVCGSRASRRCPEEQRRWGCISLETYYRELACVVMEAERPHCLPSASWRPGEPAVWFEGLAAET